MGEEIKQEAAEQPEIDTETIFEELCDELDGVFPDEMFDVIKDVRPLEVAVRLLWEYGGRIRTNNPEVDLTKAYDCPDEIDELNDVIGPFSFHIARAPFVALSRAVSAGVNADEEIIAAYNLKSHLPLIIMEDGNAKRICLIDYENRTLEITMDLGMRLNIDMTGDAIEQENAMAEGMEEFEHYLDDLKQQMTEPPNPFDSPEEEATVMTWCEKHSYKLRFTFRASIDRYF